MKTLHRALSRTLVALMLLTVAVALSPGAANATGEHGIQTILPLQTAANPYGRLRFTKLATTDSLVVAVGVWGGGITVAAAEDTTAWFDTGGYLFPEGGPANAPFVLFQVNKQATADSVGYTVQYTNDRDTALGTASIPAFTTGSVVWGTGTAVVLAAIDADDANGRWVRLIVRNATAPAATRKMSVVPVVRVVR